MIPRSSSAGDSCISPDQKSLTKKKEKKKQVAARKPDTYNGPCKAVAAAGRQAWIQLGLQVSYSQSSPVD
jgi:hypothetical protein